MPAPVASGWSESPGGPCTHWERRRLVTAHVERRRSSTQSRSGIAEWLRSLQWRAEGRSNGLGYDHAGWPGQRAAFELAPASLPEPSVRLILAIGLAFARHDEKLSRHQRRRRWLRMGRID